MPEVARVLRSGGRFAFNTATRWVYVSHPGGDGPPHSAWPTVYFDLYRVDEGDGSATFVLGYGDWVRLLRRCGLDEYVTVEWERRWPAEAIWVTRRR